MRLLLVGDVHYSRQEPECRGPNYRLEVLAKLHEASEIAKRLGAPALVLSGDILHRKGRATFQEVNDLLAVFAGWRERKGIETVGIVGNHDILGTGLESLDARAAGALHHAGVFGLLDYQWRGFGEEGDLVHLTGTSYFTGGDRSDEARIKTYGADPPPDRDALHVHVAHGALRLRGGFPAEHTTAEQLVPLLSEAGKLPDVIFCGHMHDHEGIRYFDRPDGRGRCAIVRVGSLARVSRDDLDRIPTVVALATKGRAFALREIPVGKPVALPENLAEGDPRRPDERAERIRGFVRNLRESSENYALLDHGELIRRLARDAGHGEEIVKRALTAIGRHS